MALNPLDSTQPSSRFPASGLPLDADATGEALPSGLATATPRIGWRRHVLLLAAIVGCLTVFLLARSMANHPHVPAEWRQGNDDRLELVFSPLPALKEHMGKELLAVGGAGVEPVPFNSLALTHSSRWISDPVLRQQLLKARLSVAQALADGRVVLVFRDGSRVEIESRPRGYVELGSMFWLLSAFAMVVFLVGWIVPLVQPREGNFLYGVMAHAQAAQLLLSAIASVPGLALPVLLVGPEPMLRTLLDAITGAAVLTAVLWHPLRLPGRGWLATGVWGVTGTYAAMAFAAQFQPFAWRWGDGLLLAQGVGCLLLLTWSYQRERHPFVLVMRRFTLITVLALLLLALSVSFVDRMPSDVRPMAMAAPMIWTVFLASVVLLVPFVSRSQQVMREFAMLAGISTVATSVDLLFVAVFSFSQFTSLTLSLFLSLGVYAAIRQWLINQMMGARALTTERMFTHLYRIAREVEARPERAGDRMTELLRNVFEPLDAQLVGGHGKLSRIGGNGAVLLVPVPKLVEAAHLQGMVALRFAERGKRLFTPEDARLADRIVEQLMRALAHDRAVERGRSEERTRIAQDLHDDIGARLLTLMYKSPSKEMEDYVRHTLQDLKTLTRGLAAKQHPLTLAAAEWKTDMTHRLQAARCELEWESEFDADPTLSMVQWSSITRILRELVSNTIAHAQARQVRVECRLTDGRMQIRISDDGNGRNPSVWSHGLGLGGIRKRVKAMGGTVEWLERQPRGIICQVDIPHLTPPSNPA